MPFKVDRKSDRTIFHVEPDRLPAPTGANPKLPRIPAFAGVIGFIACMFVTLLAGSIGVLLTIAWLYLCFQSSKSRIFREGIKSAENMPYRRFYDYSVDRDGIDLDSQRIEKEDIHRIRILVGPGDDVGTPTSTVVRAIDPLSVSGRAYGRSHAEITRFYQSLRPFTHRVQVETMGNPHLVAGGVTQEVAFAVKTEIEKALGSRAGLASDG